jgi:cytochrome d ubiquinol oxidase subunit I
MQALSFAVHIPLVCFGVAFPVMVLVMEWLGHRTGDPLYLAIARRWSRIMVALFAVGVITGTILSFEMGLLWPNFTATFGGVFGLGFAIEGFSFFLEAIFIGIYVYGWDRLSPRAHMLSALPIVFTGFSGSWMVIAVNAWMNHPSGFRLVRGEAVDIHPVHALFGNTYLWHELVHMYLAGYIVTGFVVAGAYAIARLRGRWSRYERTALVIPLTVAALGLAGAAAGRRLGRARRGRVPAHEARGARGPRPDRRKGAPIHVLGWYHDGEVKFGIAVPKMLSVLAFHEPNARVEGLDAVPPAERPPVNIVAHLLPDDGRDRDAAGGLLGAIVLYRRVRPTSPARVALVLLRPGGRRARCRWWRSSAGWIVTEVGRQPWVVYRVMPTSQAVTGAGGIPVGYATLWIVYLAVGAGVVWILRRLARAPLAWRRTDAMSLQELPMVFVLLGLVFYVVPRRSRLRCGHVAVRRRSGRARRADPRARPRGGRTGVGGQPRLAHLRVDRDVDRLPGGLRVAGLDAVRRPLRRRARDHRRGAAYALRSGTTDPREIGASTPPRRSPRS